MASTTRDLQKEATKATTDAITLARTTVESVQKDLSESAGDVRDAVQKVFLAGLGALAVAEEEGSRTFNTLVQKGETMRLPALAAERVGAVRAQLGEAADKATGLVTRRVATAQTTATETADVAEDRVHAAVAAVMKRLGVPTREEVAELTASVERLTDHIEKLKADRAPAATPAAPQAPAKAAAVEAPAAVEPTVEAVGGGWYEVRLGDEVVEKVQGREAADAALKRAQGKTA